MTNLLAIFGLDPAHILVLAVVGVLLFGRRLPEVGRSLGKTFVEFKKGMKGLEEEVETTSTHTPAAALPPEPMRPPQRITAQAPRFEDVPTNAPPGSDPVDSPGPARTGLAGGCSLS